MMTAVSCPTARRSLLGLAAAVTLRPGETSAQEVQFGGPIPLSFFVGARIIEGGSPLWLWQRRAWRPLSETITNLAPAQQTDLFSFALQQRVGARAGEVLSRVVQYEDPAARPRFFLVDPGPPDPTSPESAERLAIYLSIYLRDVTEDFPAPAPVGRRAIAMLIEPRAVRRTIDPLQARRWIGERQLTIETITPETAEERVLKMLEAQLVRLFTLVVPARP